MRQCHNDTLGTILTADMVGLLLGYLFVAPLSARFGHKRMVVACTAAFGASHTFQQPALRALMPTLVERGILVGARQHLRVRGASKVARELLPKIGFTHAAPNSVAWVQ